MPHKISIIGDLFMLSSMFEEAIRERCRLFDFEIASHDLKWPDEPMEHGYAVETAVGRRKTVDLRESKPTRTPRPQRRSSRDWLAPTLLLLAVIFAITGMIGSIMLNPWVGLAWIVSVCLGTAGGFLWGQSGRGLRSTLRRRSRRH